MNKTTDTLVKDIYDLVSTKEVPEGVDLDKMIDEFGESMKRTMKQQMKPYNDTGKLRLSAIGKTDRYLWHKAKGTKAEKIAPHTYLKFMYGHVIEELLLFLTKASGHTVTDEQKVCKVEGVVGHMDCTIDGLLVDVKSTSSYGFKKFKDGTLAFDDPFGYIDQLKAYAHSQNTREIGWLAMDKQNGHLCLLKYDLDDESHPAYEILKTDIAARVRHVKKMVGEVTTPELCYDSVPDGKSGNEKLAIGCSYCQYKAECYPDLRTFYYSTGVRHLTKVVNTPKVNERHEF